METSGDTEALLVSPVPSRWNGATMCIIIFLLGCLALSLSVGITATIGTKTSTVDLRTTSQSSATIGTKTSTVDLRTTSRSSATIGTKTSTVNLRTTSQSSVTIGTKTSTVDLRTTSQSSATSTLNVLSLSVWGSPASFGTEDKNVRIDAIAKFIQNNTKYDVFLLNELWMRPDHAKIASLLPEGYHMSLVGDFALSTCDGVVAPEFCSGLAVISRYPVIEQQFTSFSYHGDLFWDYEYFLRRGVGRMRISLGQGSLIDVFTTSLASLQYNHYYREKQANQLIEIIASSNADFKIVGGDFNVDPLDNEQTYPLLQSSMKNSAEEFYKHDKTKWMDPKLATLGNKFNTYSSSEHPVIYDYLWYKAKGSSVISVVDYQVPILKTKDGKGISFSTHEAVTAEFELSKS